MQEAVTESKFKTSRLRWVMLIELFFFLAFNSMTLIFLVPAALDIQKAFELDSILIVNMCAIIFSVSTLLMSFISIEMYKHMNMGVVLTFAAVIQITGGWLRLYAFVDNEFWPIFAGTTILSMSHAIFM